MFTLIGFAIAWINKTNPFVAPSKLVAGWNNLTVMQADIGKTLAQIGQSLNLDTVNWTVISKYNGTYYTYVKDYHWNENIKILVSTDRIFIYVLQAAVWYHKYT